MLIYSKYEICNNVLNSAIEQLRFDSGVLTEIRNHLNERLFYHIRMKQSPLSCYDDRKYLILPAFCNTKQDAVVWRLGDIVKRLEDGKMGIIDISCKAGGGLDCVAFGIENILNFGYIKQGNILDYIHNDTWKEILQQVQ
jgi:hypothetical protein